jgi:hypothetical protein
MLVAAIGSLVIVVLPYTPSRPVRAPLASTAVADGTAGGLLPDVRLPDQSGRPVTIRDIRPAVLLLTPDDCRCDQLIADLARVTGESRISVELVGASDQPERPPGAPEDRIFTLSDPGEVLAESITAGRASAGPVPDGASPVAVLVRADGVIAVVVPDLRDVNNLRADLARLPVT